jgi:hypothetical protein
MNKFEFDYNKKYDEICVDFREMNNNIKIFDLDYTKLNNITNVINKYIEYYDKYNINVSCFSDFYYFINNDVIFDEVTFIYFDYYLVHIINDNEYMIRVTEFDFFNQYTLKNICDRKLKDEFDINIEEEVRKEKIKKLKAILDKEI